MFDSRNLNFPSAKIAELAMGVNCIRKSLIIRWLGLDEFEGF